MALSCFVYISDVDNLSDARYAAGMGVDLVGFKLDPKGDTSINPERFQEISEWISGVKIVGEFGDSSPKEVKELLNKYRVDYLLVSDESQINDFSLLGLPLIYKAFIEESSKEDLDSTLNYCSGIVDYFLLESDQTVLNDMHTELINGLSSKYPVILGYGVHLENVSSVVSEMRLDGICLKGSPELRPGYKDFDEMADILEALDQD